MNNVNQNRVSRVSHSGRRRKVIILGIMAAIVLYLVLSGPILFTMGTGPMIGDPGLTIFNPLRSRAPEHCAEAFLELMKTGRCEEAMATISTDKVVQDTVCENERKYPLASWRLRTRTDESKRSRLSFRYKRDVYESDLFVWVEKIGDEWRVTDYKRAY